MGKVNRCIKTSSHYFENDLNIKKHDELNNFLLEYNRVLVIMINEIWVNGVSCSIENKKTKESTLKICCPSKGYYDTVKYFDYKQIAIKTELSARALSSMTSQSMSLISSAVRKHNQRVYKLTKLKENFSLNANSIVKIEKKIQKNLPKKPEIKNIPIELSSKCATLIKRTKGHFNYFLSIHSIGKKYGKILIPIKAHRHSKKLQLNGTLLNSFLINHNFIDLRWELKLPIIKIHGLIVGGDTGKNTILTLSNNITTDQFKNLHNHSLNTIIEKMANQKKGSKAFLRSQNHRTNFINWSVKQIDFSKIKEIKLEKINNIFYKNKTSRKMSHWTNAQIEKAIESVCKLNGVQITYQNSTYRSQRCSSCGFVCKLNRKGKDFKCSSCNFCLDADLNAAKNHEVNIPVLPIFLRHLKVNKTGFFWKESGLFKKDGSELKVPNTIKRNKSE